MCTMHGSEEKSWTFDRNIKKKFFFFFFPAKNSTPPRFYYFYLLSINLCLFEGEGWGRKNTCSCNFACFRSLNRVDMHRDMLRRHRPWETKIKKIPFRKYTLYNMIESFVEKLDR